MRMMITGENLKFVKVDEATARLTPSEWLSDRARKQKRDRWGQFVARGERGGEGRRLKVEGEGEGKKRKARGFMRFFVLAKALG